VTTAAGDPGIGDPHPDSSQPWAGASCDPPRTVVREIVARALAEDLVPLGDLTASLIPDGTTGQARIVSREPGVVAGRACVIETYTQIDDRVIVSWNVPDGAVIEAGTVLGVVCGPLGSMVTAERTALNFVRHLSGIATLTARYVAAARAASGGRTRILDTRKTTPGLRALEKSAVRAGGGHNHRANLSDAIMVKDNHLAGLSIAEAVARARFAWPGRPVHVECDDLAQLGEIVEARADRAMLDNFTPDQVAAGVALVNGRLEVEVTGGISLATVEDYARCRPDFISVGAITHSAGVIDIGVDLSAQPGPLRRS
jgi:nicotinate-nucleotide pyrophosphorylase (carboxylating)